MQPLYSLMSVCNRKPEHTTKRALEDRHKRGTQPGRKSGGLEIGIKTVTNQNEDPNLCGQEAGSILSSPQIENGDSRKEQVPNGWYLRVGKKM